MSDSEKPTNTANTTAQNPKADASSKKPGTAKEGARADDAKSIPPEHQDALDVMAALCREYGLEELAPDLLNSSSIYTGHTGSGASSGAKTNRNEPTETAFSILQKFLFEGDAGTASAPQSSGLDGHIPDPVSVLAKSMQSNTTQRAHQQSEPQANQQKGPDMNQSSEAASTPSYDSANAQWRLTTTQRDGSETDLAGAVISDDMFRTAMPHLRGKNGGKNGDATGAGDHAADTDQPDWTIDLAQRRPLAAARTHAQTAIGAKLTATDTPTMIQDWSLSVGEKASPHAELATSAPATAPSHLRALLFDTTVTDPAHETYSETASYGGGPYALHIEQSIGSVAPDTLPNLALIRLIFANRPAIPAQLEYIGPLPSPILRGVIPVSASLCIPFWMQITPPSEGDKGAALVILVEYNQETSFNVTAQLLTSSKSCTPTAILNCTGQSDNSACRAASMVANSNGRLETSLTGLANAPTQAELAEYGFRVTVVKPVVTPDPTVPNAKPTVVPTADQKTTGKPTGKTTSKPTGKTIDKSTGKADGSVGTDKGED
ncbi:hypothetical protein [Thalassospira lucentensis]|uniref:hypothetical protein n=1 Tax=Thalassospira lucentensis TaxID=168935 RepID=UPI003AA9709A